MRAEAKGAGLYRHALMQRQYDAIQIVTMQEMIEQGKRLDIPLGLEALRKAQASAAPTAQLPLMDADAEDE